MSLPIVLVVVALVVLIWIGFRYATPKATLLSTDDPLWCSTEVRAAEIEDWQVELEDGTIRGGFTTLAQAEIATRERQSVPPHSTRTARLLTTATDARGGLPGMRRLMRGAWLVLALVSGVSCALVRGHELPTPSAPTPGFEAALAIPNDNRTPDDVLVVRGLRAGTAPHDVLRVPRGEVAEVRYRADVESDCVLPSDPTTILEDRGLVLKVWTFPLEEVHVRPVLPDEPGFLAYRAAIRAEGADERYPALHVPPDRNGNADVWRDENFNNDLAYHEGVGSIDPITCLDALLFAEQNARVPQLERPTEFLASVLRRRLMERDEVVVVFGAGTELFPPASVHGFEIVDEYVAAGWRYWYVLHNHTRQANGALGVPVPSASDVNFARNLAAQRGLERIRVTNGFYSFDATVAEISTFRAR